jgi:hypothetical protein
VNALPPPMSIAVPNPAVNRHPVAVNVARCALSVAASPDRSVRSRRSSVPFLTDTAGYVLDDTSMVTVPGPWPAVTETRRPLMNSAS